jgi:hypothetical protein
MEYIGEWEFEEQYVPLDSPDGGNTWEYEDTLQHPPERVWTLLDGEDGGIWASPGYHIVNKIGYVVTEKPWTDPGLDAVWVDAADLAQTETGF